MLVYVGFMWFACPTPPCVGGRGEANVVFRSFPRMVHFPRTTRDSSLSLPGEVSTASPAKGSNSRTNPAEHLAKPVMPLDLTAFCTT